MELELEGNTEKIQSKNVTMLTAAVLGITPKHLETKQGSIKNNVEHS